MNTNSASQNYRRYLSWNIKQKWTLSIVLAIVVCMMRIDQALAFTPGAGGAIADVTPFISTPNVIGGLFVSQNHRYPYSFTSGTYPQVNFTFPLPSTYGATTVTLQYSTDGATWLNFQANNADVTTDYNNFSVQPDGDYQYRLLFNGGPNDGYTSNVVTAQRSTIDTRFAGWGLDESMSITDVILPWVGRGLTASFTVRDIEDESEITGHLDYQWYRVNPATYEMTPIDGATDLTYVTTLEDVGGYRLICRATGDGTVVGGYAQVGSLEYATVIPNLAEVSNLTSHGFKLSLQKSIESLLPQTLTLTYQDPVTFDTIQIAVTAVIKLADAVYQVTAEIPLTVFSLYLQNTSDTWRIATAMGEEPFLMVHEGVSLTVDPTHTLTVNSSGTGSGVVTGGGTYDHGTAQQISAIADEGSSFTGWSGDCTGTTDSLTVLMDSNKICTANFKKPSSLFLFLPAIIKH